MRKQTNLRAGISWTMTLIAALALSTGAAIGSEKAAKTEKKPAASESSHGKAASSGNGEKAPAKAAPAKAAASSSHGSSAAPSSSHGSSAAATASKPKTPTAGASHGSTVAEAKPQAEPAKAEPAAGDAGHGAAAAGAAEAPTGAEVLKRLAEGNTRFVTGKSQHPNADAIRRAETAAKGQKPTVTVVSCSDSRVPVEILLDAGIGDVFVVRVAGNVCDTDEIGTVEYGTEHLGTPLLVVLGHTKCGAVTAVTKQDKVGGSIPKLVDNIAPAVAAAQKAHPDLHGDALVPEAIKANVFQSIEDLLKNSEIVRHLVSSGKLQIEGGLYDLEKGTIQWLGKHPNEKELLSAAGAGHEAQPAAGPEAHASATTKPSDAHADAAPASDPHAANGHADQTVTHASPTTRPSPTVAAATQPSHEVAAATQPAATVASAGPAAHTPPATQPHGNAPQHADADGTKVLGWSPTERPSNGHSPIANQAGPTSAGTSPATQPAAVSNASKPTEPASAHKTAPSAPSVALQRGGPGLLERTMADELYRQGAVHLVRGDDAAASERFRAALEADPNLLPALNDLAGICYLQRDYNRALELYAKVLAAQPSDESALRGSALAYASQKRYAESRDILQRLLTRNGGDAQTWLDFGDVQFLMGDKAGAMNAWKQAAQVGPSTATVVTKATQRLERYE